MTSESSFSRAFRNLSEQKKSKKSDFFFEITQVTPTVRSVWLMLIRWKKNYFDIPCAIAPETSFNELLRNVSIYRNKSRFSRALEFSSAVKKEILWMRACAVKKCCQRQNQNKVRWFDVAKDEWMMKGDSRIGESIEMNDDCSSLYFLIMLVLHQNFSLFDSKKIPSVIISNV